MTLTDELTQLVDEVNAAQSIVYAATGAANLADMGAVDLPEVTALRTVEEGRIFRKKNVDVSDEALTAAKKALLERLAVDDDLSLVSTGGATFRVEDRGPARRLEEARAALREATANLEQFKAENREELLRLADESQRAAFKDDLASGDPHRVREALGMNPKALTTAQLGG